ncbi:MAG: hypothetical protein AMXMBFR53_03610 [Gemmatimonadota bacterium]
MDGRQTNGLVLEAERLRLTAMTLEALQAWVDGDAGRLAGATGAVFDEPPTTPPLFGEDLPMFRDRMAETPEELGWWVWLVSRREDRRAVGVCGLGGRPGAEGAALIGYSVYPRFEGRGYATEACRALVAWVLGQPGAILVRATVPAENHASVAVLRKLGMVQVGVERHPEVGDVAVYETPALP